LFFTSLLFLIFSIFYFISDMAINILVAEDHFALRNSMKDILERIDDDFQVISLAENGKVAVDLVRCQQPDIILMDIEMPIMNGIEATKLIVDEHPGIGIIAFSMLDEGWAVKEMVNAGARGYLLKDTGKLELKEAIKSVAEGKTFFCKEVERHVG
jgi:DNA-binding NarL/FixJ family response regulator